MDSREWRNSSETETARPRQVAAPHSVDELASLVGAATEHGTHVKAVGSGHSFTGAAVTDGIMVRLDHLTGIVGVEPTDDGALVTVLAGTTLHELNAELWARGLALANLGDVDVQTIAGAVSTGTHGTGGAFGGLATQIRALDVVLSDGTVAHCSPTENPTLFEAARLGLGAIGIVTALTLACVPAFALHARESSDTLDAVLERLDHDRANTDHFEFYWFPHTRRALTKHNTRMPVDTPLEPVPRVSGYLDDELLSNTLFEGINRFGTAFPAAIPRINVLSSRLLGSREYTDRSYRVYASPRRVRFREMEYAIPVDALESVLGEIDRWITRTDFHVAFPVEVRFACADDVWLSTAHGRTSAYVAVHQYHRRPHDTYFRAVEHIAREVDGRPHWGKLHYRTAADLRPAYPHFDEFVSVRDEFDPTRTFHNPYLATVLG